MDTAEIQATKDEQLLAVKGEQHSRAFLKSSHWTEIEETPRPELENVCILPGETIQKFSCDNIRFHEQIDEGGQGKIYHASLLVKGIDGEYVKYGNGKYVVKKFKGALHESHFGQWPEELIGVHSHCHFVCNFLGYFKDENSFCLLMPKYDNSLRGCIVEQMKKGWLKRSPFSDYATMGIIIQIAIGMGFVHDLNIMHRDLKADNIFVNVGEDDKDYPAIAIGDFDIAPTVEGTGFWRAPEILQAKKDKQRLFNVGSADSSKCSSVLRDLPFTKKSDVYSFGMTCYEVLTGGIPFEGSRFSNYDGVLSGERPKLPSTLNPKMRDLVNRCWHHDPDARPTFEEIVTELKGLVGQTKSLMDYFSIIHAYLRIHTADFESNLVELKYMVHVLDDKYTQEDFVGLGFELFDAIEQFKLEFGFRSFMEHPSLPFSKWHSRCVLFDTIDFKRRMFLAACPDIIPEYQPVFNLIHALFNDIMQKDPMAQNVDAIIKEENISEEDMVATLDAWHEEKQRRLQLLEIDLLERQKVLGKDYIASRHDVCHALLTKKLNIGRDIYQPCDFCKALPYYAPKPLQLKACTFHLYTPNHLMLKCAITSLFHIMRKLFLCWLKWV